MLIHAGKAKFGLVEDADVTLVTESDGTEVDEDDVLQDLDKGTVLILLSIKEKWEPPTLDMSSSAGKSSSENTETASVKTTTSTSTLKATSSSGSEIDYHSNSTSSRITKATPLPCFSPRVLQHLNCATESSVWREIVSEAANYYVTRCPELNSAGEYYTIGKNICSLPFHVLSRHENG